MLAALADRARESSRQPRKSSETETSYAPGNYDLDGISFTLHSPLIGSVDPSVIGYASTSSILALLSTPLDAGSIFVDDNQRLLKVGKMFTQNKDVLFYNISVENPLAVFSNLRFRSTGRSAPHDKSDNDKTTRAGNSDATWPGIVQRKVRLHWEEGQPRPRPRECAGFKTQVGAKVDAVASLDAQFKGFEYFRADVTLDVDATIGTGFTAAGATLAEKICGRRQVCHGISGDTRRIAGFALGGNLSLCAKVGFSYTGGDKIGKKIDYYREWAMTVRRHGTFATGGSHFNLPRGEVLCDFLDLVEVDGAFTLAQNLEIIPTIEFYGETRIQVGSNTWKLKVGLATTVELRFEWNQDKCIAPYVWRSGLFSVFHFDSAEEAIIFGSKILGNEEVKAPWLSGKDMVKAGCLFAKREPAQSSLVVTLDTKGTTPVKFKQGEVEGIIKFPGLGNAVPGPGSCYALLSLDDLIPLVLAWQFGETTWIIRVTTENVQKGVLSVPFHRRSSGAYESRAFWILRLFHGPAELFCRETFEKIPIGQLPVGCLEPIERPWERKRIDWHAMGLDDGDKGGARYPWVVQGDAFPHLSCNAQYWGLEMFPRKPKYVQIVKAGFLLRSDMASLVIPKTVVQAWRERGLAMTFRGYGARSLRFYHSAGTVNVLPKDPGGSEFSVKPDWEGHVRVAATDDGLSSRFRIFDLSVTELTLFRYPDEEGLIQVSGSRKFESGLNRQIIRPGTTGQVYKSWPGEWTRTVLKTPGELSVRCCKNGTTWNFKVYYKPNGEADWVEIPWGVRKYFDDPANFFESVGIAPPDLKVNSPGKAAILNFDGVLVVKEGQIDLAKLKSAKIAELVDLEQGDVVNEVTFWEEPNGGGTLTPMEDHMDGNQVFDGLGADTALMIEVSVGAFVGAVIVSLVGFVVYKRRSRRKEKSSSALSNESSSDQVLREGLTERVE